MFIGDDPADIPVNKAGNPVRGKFTEDTNHDPYVTGWPYEFDLGDAVSEDSFVVVAHADVLTLGEVDGIIVVTSEETAWVWGEASFNGRSTNTIFSIDWIHRLPDGIE